MKILPIKTPGLTMACLEDISGMIVKEYKESECLVEYFFTDPLGYRNAVVGFFKDHAEAHELLGLIDIKDTEQFREMLELNFSNTLSISSDFLFELETYGKEAKIVKEEL